MKGQKKEEGKPVKVKGVEEWEVEKILNKRKIRGIEKYLVQWKRFTIENDTWERGENLGNIKKLVNKFKGRLSVEVRRQEKVETRRRIKENLEDLRRNI